MAVELQASDSAQEHGSEPETEPTPNTEATPESAPTPETEPTTAAEQPARQGLLRYRRATPVLALVALVMSALAVTQVLTWRSAQAQQRDGAAATSAAAKAVPALLSYDYRTLAADLAAARPYLTDSFATEYDQVAANTVQPSAVSRQVATSAAVTGTSVVSHAPDSVVVLLFVNQTTSALPVDAKGVVQPKAKPVQSLDLSRVRVLMKREDGQWRVADLRGL